MRITPSDLIRWHADPALAAYVGTGLDLTRAVLLDMVRANLDTDGLFRALDPSQRQDYERQLDTLDDSWKPVRAAIPPDDDAAWAAHDLHERAEMAHLLADCLGLP